MEHTDKTPRTTIDELMARLEANPHFVQKHMDEAEVSITFLSKDAAARAKAAQEKSQP